MSLTTMFILTVVTGTLILTVTLILTTSHPGRHRQSRHDDTRIMEHLSRELDLDTSQKPLVAVILADLTAMGKEGEALRKEWYAQAVKQLQEESNETHEFTAFNNKLASKIEEIGKRFSEAVRQLKTILSPEQRQKLVVALVKHNTPRHTR